MYLLAEADSYQYRGAQVPYVLDLVPISSGLAVISSDQKLCLFNPLRLSEGPRRTFLTSHGNITAVRVLDLAGSILATAGENGTVALWDLRDSVPEPQITAQAGSCNASIASLACEPQTRSVAAGTEFADHQASILIWDIRSPGTPRVQYNDVHSDDITELNFHPRDPHVLLSGSTDGLVNVCDTRQTDEDEVVITAFNHGASIHHAGFLNNTEVFALSHDEKFALYDMDEEVPSGTATTKDFGDMRQVVGCQYVANVIPKVDGLSAVIGAGSQDAQMFQLIHLSKTSSWNLDSDSVVGLPGAHGSEIVRSFRFLDEEKVVYTGGEDGTVKAWRPNV